MASRTQTERYLVLDVGHVFTRAFLLDVVEGRYRLVSQSAAPSTWEAPVQDVREGVLNALELLERASGLRLTEEGEIIKVSQPSGEGVDSVVVLMSAGPPMRVAVMGILESVSVRSALRALEPFPTETALVFHVNDHRSELQRLEALLNQEVDLILLTGGTNQGTRGAIWDYVRLLRRAAEFLPEGARPVVLFAGNEALGDRVQEWLQQAYQVHRAPNVRPSLFREDLKGVRKALQEVYRDYLLRRLPGTDGLLELADLFEPVPLAWKRMARFLAAFYQTPEYLGLYQGSGLSFVLQGHVDEGGRLHCYAYGLGHGLAAAREELEEALPVLEAWAWDLDDPWAELLHKTVYPESVPVTPAEAWLERGLAFLLGRRVLESFLPSGARRRFRREGLAPEVQLLVTGGGVWSFQSHLEATVLTALDLFQPRGTLLLLSDLAHLMAPLGAVARLNPLVAVHLARSSAFVPLATVVAPWGFRPRGRRPVARVTLSWEPRQTTRVDLHPGELRVLPLPPGARGVLEVQPASGVDVGAGPGRTVRQEIPGSWVGVVLDARGRPVPQPRDREQYRALRQQWWQALQQREA